MNALPELTRTIALDDGTTTNLTQWGERGPAMVCVHGLTSSRIGWQRFAGHYSDRFRIFAYDQRGHGESFGNTQDMRIERVFRDFVNVTAAIGEPIDVAIGHSWGGAVVIGAAPQADVRRTIAVDPALRQIGSTWYDEYLEELQPVFCRHGDERDAYVRQDYSDAHPLDREGKVHAMRSMVPASLMNVREQNPPGNWNLLGEIATFPMPLLLALADPAETVVVAEDFKALQEVRNPMVRVQVFSGEGHSLHRTAFDRFTQTVDSFLAESESMV